MFEDIIGEEKSIIQKVIEQRKKDGTYFGMSFTEFMKLPILTKKYEIGVKYRKKDIEDVNSPVQIYYEKIFRPDDPKGVFIINLELIIIEDFI